MPDINEPTDMTAPSVPAPKPQPIRRTIAREIFFLLMIALVGGAAYFTGFERGQSGAARNEMPLDPRQAVILDRVSHEKDLDFGLFWKVWDLLKEKYVDHESLDAHKLLYGAINGMLSASGDPYTTFFDPEAAKAFDEEIAGSFDGIGAEMGMKDKVLTIIAPLEGMPAEKAGLLAGDKVLKIDGEPTDSLSLDVAVSKIRGKRGTEVKLTIYRDGESETRDITITRDVINVKSVRIEDKKNGIELIRISRFGEDTTKEFQNALKDVIAAKPSGIVLDMRNNPGGLLNAAVDIAGEFLPKDAVVVIEEDAEKKRDSLVAKGANRLGAIPIVILINGGSASASEILAGALRDDRQDVRIVGETSFGKGSVQELIPVSATTKVKITVAHWLTPSGKQINKVGIEPDVTVALTAADIEKKRDPQMDKALEMLRAKKVAPTR
jgi:carboxyl-terminal processing protease